MGISTKAGSKLFSRKLETRRSIYEIYSHKQADGLLRCKIQSRHTGSQMFNFCKRCDNENVNGWYCHCKTGAGVIGCCGHIAWVIWYLGYSRQQQNVSEAISQFKFLEDAAENVRDWDASNEGSDAE